MSALIDRLRNEGVLLDYRPQSFTIDWAKKYSMYRENFLEVLSHLEKARRHPGPRK